MVTKAWRVYGINGHRQKESFNNSYKYDFSTESEIRIIEVLNADRTGTNDYSEIRITMDTPEACEKELRGQLSDGVFENAKFGIVEEI